MMITKMILKMASSEDAAANDLVLWCLHGGGVTSYEGLLSLMAHGDPKRAKDRDVESIAWEVSSWWVCVCKATNLAFASPLPRHHRRHP